MNFKKLREQLNNIILMDNKINEDMSNEVSQKEQEVKQILKDRFVNIVDNESLSNLSSALNVDSLYNFKNFFSRITNYFRIINNYKENMITDLEEHPDEKQQVEDWYESKISEILINVDKEINKLGE